MSVNRREPTRSTNDEYADAKRRMDNWLIENELVTRRLLDRMEAALSGSPLREEYNLLRKRYAEETDRMVPVLAPTRSERRIQAAVDRWVSYACMAAAIALIFACYQIADHWHTFAGGIICVVLFQLACLCIMGWALTGQKE
jgi:hypothetical protein